MGKGSQELRLWVAGLWGPAVWSTEVYINVEHTGGIFFPFLHPLYFSVTEAAFERQEKYFLNRLPFLFKTLMLQVTQFRWLFYMLPQGLLGRGMV